MTFVKPERVERLILACDEMILKLCDDIDKGGELQETFRDGQCLEPAGPVCVVGHIIKSTDLLATYYKKRSVSNVEPLMYALTGQVLDVTDWKFFEQPVWDTLNSLVSWNDRGRYQVEDKRVKTAGYINRIGEFVDALRNSYLKEEVK